MPTVTGWFKSLCSSRFWNQWNLVKCEQLLNFEGTTLLIIKLWQFHGGTDICALCAIQKHITTKSIHVHHLLSFVLRKKNQEVHVMNFDPFSYFWREGHLLIMMKCKYMYATKFNNRYVSTLKYSFLRTKCEELLLWWDMPFQIMHLYR